MSVQSDLRIRRLVREMAACFRPTTLEAVIEDLEESANLENADVAFLVARMRDQLGVLVGDGDLQICGCGAEGVRLLRANGKCDVCNGVE